MKRKMQEIAGKQVLAFSLLIILASAAHAEGDGGTRSVFAYGAGTRATGMGGAYVAIADDASGPTWNPGGLGQLERSEFMASHATLYGLGFNEQYAFVALPSWRWGVGGFGFRRFAVDGIERRDDLNVLLDDDLTRSESELSLSYGHELGAAWSMGATAKLRRVSFAEFSGSGLGLDFGVMGRAGIALGLDSPWAERIRVGLAVRNLLEPSVRLDQDSVPDPTGLRVGTSLHVPFSVNRSLLLGFDVERTTGMDPRLSAGMELCLHPMLALRAGILSGGFSAGTGVRWRDLSFNYTFEQNDFDSVQRAGLTMHFGATVEERRVAAIKAEERELNARLEEAFERRQAQRIANLITEARSARAAGRLEEALEILATADALDPENGEIRGLEVAFLRDLGGELEARGDLVAASMRYSRALAIAPDDSLAALAQDRCRAESDRRAARSAELRRQFAAALDAFVANDLAAAREGFKDVLAAGPDDEALAMLQRTEQAMSRRAADLVGQAASHVRWGHLDRAGDLLDQASKLKSDADGLERTRKVLAEARRKEREAARAAAVPSEGPTTSSPAASGPPAHARLTEKEEKELAELYQRGMSAIEAGHADEALRYWELVWAINPDYLQVKENLKREYVTRGMELFASRELREAVEMWEHATRIDPADERTIEYLNRAREQLSRAEAIRDARR